MVLGGSGQGILIESRQCILFIVPLTPTKLFISKSYMKEDSITVTLEWDQPIGVGPEYLVEGYRVLLLNGSEIPISETQIITKINLTLDYGINYTAAVISINCIGESLPLLLTDIIISMLSTY